MRFAKYWLPVLSEIKNRGANDVCIVVCYGLKRLPAAIETVWRKRFAASDHANMRSSLAQELVAVRLEEGLGRNRWINRWKAPLNAFEIAFPGRLNPGRK